jgi:hypothetical protein
MSRVQVGATYRRLWAVTLVLAALGVPRAGRARTVVVATRLDYATAPGCPTDDNFQTIVTARLGYNPFRADVGDLVVVRIDPAGKTLEGRLEWRDVNGRSIGEQTFPSRTGDCAELARAMGFALALQIQLMAATVGEARLEAPPAPATEPPAARPPTVSAAPAPAAHVEAAPAAPSDGSARPEGPSLLAGAGMLAGLGISSTPIAVGRLFATVAWPHLAVELAGEVSAPSTTNRADGAGFSQEEFLASLAGCGVSGPFGLCAVGKIGELRVVGQGVDVALTASGLMIQSGLRATAAHTFGRRTYIIAHAEGLARLTEGTVTLDSMPVWTTPRFAALLGIDIAFRFR